MEILNTLSDKLNLSSGLLLFIIGGFVLWKIFRFVYKTKEMHDGWDGVCGQVDELIDGHNKLMEKFDTVVDLIKPMGEWFYNSAYGKSNSPIKLKEKWKQVIETSNLKNQITANLPKFIEEIKSNNPETPLDAQSLIHEKTSTEWISLFDLKEYKENLYEAGATEVSIAPILFLYLQELIITELFPKNK